MKGKLLTLSLLAATALSGFATEYDFSYDEGLEPVAYGFDKKETYDVAIRIADPTTVGSRVQSFTVLLEVDPEAITDISGWLTTELKLEKKKNVPNICSVDAQVENNYLTVTFPEPYTITEEGVYVGYSFTITDTDRKYGWPNAPITVVPGKNEDGLYVHTSRTRMKWSSIVPSISHVSTMVVTLDGDFAPNSTALSLPAMSYVPAFELTSVKASVVSHASEPITKLGYEYTVGDFKGNGEVILPEAIVKAGERAVVEFPIEAIEKCDTYPFSLTITSANGEANTDAHASGEGQIVAMPFVPVNRPLFEEFTGLGCGFCPRGYIAMEEMSKIYGDQFVGMAYHSNSYESNGAMVVMENDNFPVYVSGFPAGTINRGAVIDPSYFPYEFEEYAEGMPLGDLDITLDWADEDKTELTATATAKFVQNLEGTNYRISIALVADGLKNDNWRQSNYYAGEEPDGIESDLWDLFINGKSKVAGLTFNDVVVYYPDVFGIENTIPENISITEGYTASISVKKDDVVNLAGQQFINEDATVKAVAIILDATTGTTVNANKSAKLAWNGDSSSVADLEAAEVVNTTFYDLQGRKVVNPAQGIFVKIETLSNGTTRRSKVAVK